MSDSPHIVVQPSDQTDRYNVIVNGKTVGEKITRDEAKKLTTKLLGGSEEKKEKPKAEPKSKPSTSKKGRK